MYAKCPLSSLTSPVDPLFAPLPSPPLCPHGVPALQEEDAVLVCFQQDLLFNVSPNDILMLLRDAEAALLASAARLRPAGRGLWWCGVGWCPA